MHGRELDEKDRKIIALLQENAKRTTQDIAKRLLMPVTTVHHRIKKMEQLGVVVRYVAMVDHAKLGKPIEALILVTVDYVALRAKGTTQEQLARQIMSLPGIEESAIVTGGTDIVLKVRVKDVSALNDFVINHLRNVDGVEKTQTMVVLRSFDRVTHALALNGSSVHKA